ncbi:lipase 3 isoform X2 [Folsomia candida]|uniref:lipase 3 isoform X2 n=1 Tax=Folsomia candida TaxID=158441 RepID=UPI001604D70C|nr:lipase 3 isoform X2 [Folsomia candida]
MTVIRTRKKYKVVGVFIIVIFLKLSCASGYLLELAKYIPSGIQVPSWITYQNQDKTSGKRFSNNAVGIIRGNGYPVEVHNVITDDGFILEMHRIPRIFPSQNMLPVLLMHGNLQSSADWKQVIEFFCSIYPVRHGIRRVAWKPQGQHVLQASLLVQHKFCQILGFQYDFPALVDYVLKQTGHSKLHYISFSYSTTVFIAGLTLKPEYNAKIASGIVMGPSVFQANFANGLFYYFSFSAKLISAFMDIFGTIPLLPHFYTSLLNVILPIFCNPKFDVIGICPNFIRLALGDDGNLIRKEQLPLITSVAPAPSGLKQVNHLLQLTGSRNFVQYDYGRARNIQLYGAIKPPSYNLSEIRVPIALFVGGYDFIAHREDAKKLASKLPNLYEYYNVPYKQFCHIDFTYGREVAADVYFHAVDIMKKHDP